MKHEVNPAIQRAMNALRVAVPRAESDPTRPVCHFRAPAQWMNDPNGPIWHGGYYHMFYQLNPYGESWGPVHWGHARSRDLVRWEHLPIALWPSAELGEDGCWSGCVTVNGDGRPMAFYTSIGRRTDPRETAAQCAALGDEDLITWEKHPANPLLTEALHGGRKVYDWRDPHVFRHEGAAHLVLGGNLNRARGGQGVVNIYRARDAALAKWEYLGVLFQHPAADVTNVECPNFFQLGDRWVLVISPHGPVHYFVGRFDTQRFRFEPESTGLLDQTFSFYAPNSMTDPSGRRLLWGWVKDFTAGRGWNGCLSLPRVLRLLPDGRLAQAPAPELEKLRRNHRSERDLRLSGGPHSVDACGHGTLEAMADMEIGTGGEAGLVLRGARDNSVLATVRVQEGRAEVAGASAPLAAGPEAPITCHLFFDRSVLEVYVGESLCFTRVIEAGEVPLKVEAFANAHATVRSLDTWELEPIW